MEAFSDFVCSWKHWVLSKFHWVFSVFKGVARLLEAPEIRSACKNLVGNGAQCFFWCWRFMHAFSNWPFTFSLPLPTHVFHSSPLCVCPSPNLLSSPCCREWKTVCVTLTALKRTQVPLRRVPEFGRPWLGAAQVLRNYEAKF